MVCYILDCLPAMSGDLDISAYPIAYCLAEIGTEKTYVGRKLSGQMEWSYTFSDAERYRFHKIRNDGEIMTAQRPFPGDPGSRDFALLAWRRKK